MIKKYGDDSDSILVGETTFFNIESRNITKKVLEESWAVIASFLKCYPPNVIKVKGKGVWYYHGLEEGLMFWDSVDKRKLKKLIRKFGKVNYGK